MTLVVRPTSSFFRVKVVAAGVALVVHGSVVALLMMGLSPEPGSGPVIKTMTTELIAMAPPVETTEPLSLDPQSVPDVASPETEPQPVPEPEPLPESPPQPEPKPVPPSDNSAAEVAAADLARKRVADEKRQEELARQKREQQQQERQREKAAQQQRKQAQDAELARQRHAANLAAAAAAASAEENRQRLADSQQYLPISKKAPDYPRRALGQRLEGDCTVGYTVTPQGHVQAPKVIGECHPLFVRPSIEAAKAFKYQPRLINGMAVAVPNVRNTFHYKIEDR